MRVAKNRETIRGMNVRILSGLRLEVQADPTDQGRYTLKTAYSQLLRSKYQVCMTRVHRYDVVYAGRSEPGNHLPREILVLPLYRFCSNLLFSTCLPLYLHRLLLHYFSIFSTHCNPLETKKNHYSLFFYAFSWKEWLEKIFQQPPLLLVIQCTFVGRSIFESLVNNT